MIDDGLHTDVQRLRFGSMEESVDPGDRHHLALHLSGRCRLDRPVSGRWRSFHPRPGDLSLAPAGGDGRFRNTGEANILKLSLPAAALKQAAAEIAPGWCGDLTGRTAVEDHLAKELVLAIWQEAQGGEDATGATRRAAEWLLALRLARLVLSPREEPQHGGLADWQLRRAFAFMDARLALGFLLPELACELGLSVSHLCAQFKRATGRSVMRHFALMRLERGRQRLLESRAPVAQIAHELGYATPAHFGERFRAHFGASPAAFRRAKGMLLID